jgi:hypothetical protein
LPPAFAKNRVRIVFFAIALNDFANGLEFGCAGSVAVGTVPITTCVTFALRPTSFLKFVILIKFNINYITILHGIFNINKYRIKGGYSLMCP